MEPMQSSRDDLRIAAVEEHVRHENRHDIDGLLSTFGGNAVYEDGPWGERHDGLSACASTTPACSGRAGPAHQVHKRHVSPTRSSSRC